MTADTNIDKLLGIMRRLRAPGTGCPWDLEQDFGTIAPYTIEEAYEVADAIARSDMDGLCEELGDLLFQVVFHAQMASEAGHFGFADVTDRICEKMIRRHPHVFADQSVADAAAQTRAWEQHKARERGARESLLDDVPLALPALTRADKLQRRASHAGFDWPSIHGVSDKVEEELEELCGVIDAGADRETLLEEAGDLLFASVNLIRHAGLDPEAALRRGNEKFERRFRQVEAMCKAAGTAVADTDLDTLDTYWDRVKALETGG